jgi:hypothetical protein
MHIDLSQLGDEDEQADEKRKCEQADAKASKLK